MIAWTFPTVYSQKSTEERSYLKFLWDALGETKKDKVLLKLLIFFTIIMGTWGAYDELASLMVRNIGFNISQVGIIGSVSYIVISLGAVSAPYLHKVHSALKKESTLFFLAGCLFTVVGLKTLPILIVLLIMAEYLISAAEVKLEAKIQHQIDSHKRATMLSIKGLLLELCVILTVAVMSLISQSFGINSILLLLGGVLIITSLVFRKSFNC